MTPTPNELITVAVVDDHPLFREGVVRCLNDAGRFQVVAEGMSGDDANRIAETIAPEILLLDLSMPGGGAGSVASILTRNPRQKIVVLTVSESSDDTMTAMKGGARGYALKGVGSDALVDILLSVAGGERYLAPTLAARLLSELATDSETHRDDPLSLLTKKERTILELMAQGLSNKHIARALDLQEKTIKHYVTHILAKMKVKNRTEAAIAFHKRASRASTGAASSY